MKRETRIFALAAALGWPALFQLLTTGQVREIIFAFAAVAALFLSIWNFICLICAHMESARSHRQVVSAFRDRCKVGGLEFEVGDRIEVIDYKRIGSRYGEVVNVAFRHPESDDVGVRVKLDDWPTNRPLFFPASDLTYDRRER